MTGLYGDSLLRNQMVDLFMSIDSELMRSDISGFRPGMSRTFGIVGRFLSSLAEKAREHRFFRKKTGKSPTEYRLTPSV